MKQVFQKMKRMGIFILFSAVVMTQGCATAPTPTGHLDDGIVKLTPDHGDKSLLWWEKSDFDWRSYRKLMIDPVSIRIETDNGGGDIDQEKLDAFIKEVLEAFTQRIEPDYPVVSVPGNDVLRIRAVVTDIDTAHPAINLATTLAAFVPMDMGGASIEVEFIDSITGERLAAMADRKTGSPLQLKAGFSKFGYAKAAFNEWADELKIALAENP